MMVCFTQMIKIIKNPTTKYFLERYKELEVKQFRDYTLSMMILGNESKENIDKFLKTYY